MTDSGTSPADLAHADIGIVCALPMELAPFFDRCERVRSYSGGEFSFRGGRYDGVRIAAVICGMGFANARRATQALVDAHTPAWILSAGFAGALRDGMKVGNIVMASSLADTHGNELSVEMNAPSDPSRGLYVGRIVTVDSMVRTVAEKRALAARFDALAVDMESLAVAQVARDTKTRFVAVRSISDDLSEDLPPEVLAVTGSTGTTRLGAALTSIWKRPGSVKDMWRLREAAQVASDQLANFLDGVIRQLYAAHH